MTPRPAALLALAAATLAAAAWAQTSPQTMPAAPAAQPASSPAHPGEMITLKSADHDISAYLVAPKDNPNPGCVVLVHDIFGMTDFTKTEADQFS
ncbi:MAG TPA: hypothetical protein VHQ47_08440, partial [Phycisphaerae bacterium]|nr:hypothetical protein [Phycisphaerae bacterium]